MDDFRESDALLGPGDPAPIEIIAGAGGRPVIVACDHAGRAIPARLAQLGLAERYLRDHIAWDIGAAGVARALARRLGATAVLGGYSRLVVDLNRSLGDASAFPRVSDGVLVPGNVSLSALGRRQRARALFEPYHAALTEAIAAASRGAERPALIAVHSFTPRMHGVPRPWHVGVLWDKDPRIALPLMRALRRERGLVVGDNEPYSGRHPADYTIDYHAEASGLAHVGIEIRQDLLPDAAAELGMAERLAAALAPTLADPALYTPLAQRSR